jgi:peptidoglycan/LPS O-acetylase OafA/YrhL
MENKSENKTNEMKSGSYLKFAAMIATSTLVMWFLMYLNTYQLDHAYFSETRTYMAFVMGAAMAAVMLLFMLGMYKNRRVNAAILAGSVIVFAGALWLVRSQATVEDVSWMKAMIPHHSIAILTSERADITDPRVRKLAAEIIEAQRREIDEMKALIKELENK